MEGDPRIDLTAAWVLLEVEKEARVYQERVARHVRENVGQDLAYRNNNGNRGLDKRITEAFRELSGDRVVWERGSQCWRLRRPHDKSSRMQA